MISPSYLYVNGKQTQHLLIIFATFTLAAKVIPRTRRVNVQSRTKRFS